MSEIKIWTQGPKLLSKTFGHVLNTGYAPHIHYNVLYEMHKDGSSHRFGVAIPKDRGDLLRLVATLLAPEFGELASQAIVASLIENKED